MPLSDEKCGPFHGKELIEAKGKGHLQTYWLNYAKLLGDKSYENLFKNEIKDNFLKSVLKDQYNFRKSDFESD